MDHRRNVPNQAMDSNINIKGIEPIDEQLKYMNPNFVENSDSSSTLLQPQISATTTTRVQSPGLVCDVPLKMQRLPSIMYEPRLPNDMPKFNPQNMRLHSKFFPHKTATFAAQKEKEPILQVKTLKEMGYNKTDVEGWEEINQPMKTNLYVLLRNMIDNHIKANIQVRIGDVTFNCHMMVLQCYSEFFMECHQEVLIQLPEEKVAPGAFMMVYDWMLADEPLIQREGIMELFIAANFLRIKNLINQCWLCLDDDVHFREDTAFMLYLEARQHSLPALEELMLTRVFKFFLTLVSSSDFLELSPKELSTLLNLNSIGVNSEIEIFMSVVRWCDHEWETRQHDLIRLLDCVRFNLMPAWFLVTLNKQTESPEINRITAHPEVKKLINEGISFTTTQMVFGTQREEFYQFLERYQLTSPMQRQWVYDSTCKYHHNPDCSNMQHVTYESFLQYLDMIQKIGKTYWKTLVLAQDNKTCIACTTRNDASGSGVVKSSKPNFALNVAKQCRDQSSQVNELPNQDDKQPPVQKSNVREVPMGVTPMGNPPEDLYGEVNVASVCRPSRPREKHQMTMEQLHIEWRRQQRTFQRAVDSIKRPPFRRHHPHQQQQDRVEQQQKSKEEQQHSKQQPKQEPQKPGQQPKQEPKQQTKQQPKQEPQQPKQFKPIQLTQSLKPVQQAQHFIPVERPCELPMDPSDQSTKQLHSVPHLTSKDLDHLNGNLQERNPNCPVRILLQLDETAKRASHLQQTPIQETATPEQLDATSPRHRQASAFDAVRPNRTHQEHGHKDIGERERLQLHDIFVPIDKDLEVLAESVEASEHWNPPPIVAGDWRRADFEKQCKDETSQTQGSDDEMDVMNARPLSVPRQPEVERIERMPQVQQYHQERIQFTANSWRPGSNCDERPTQVIGELQMVTKLATMGSTSTTDLTTIFTRKLSHCDTTDTNCTPVIDGQYHCEDFDLALSPLCLAEMKLPSVTPDYLQRLPYKKILLFGGIDPYCRHCENTEFPEQPRPRSTSTGVGYDGHFNSHIMTNNGNQVLFYDEYSKEWNHVSYIPFGARNHHATVYLNGRIYVIGGTRTMENCTRQLSFEKSIWNFDPATFQWTLEGSLPEARRDFAVITMDETVKLSKAPVRLEMGFYVIGGEGYDGLPLSTVWFYSVMTKTWTQKASLNMPRYGLTAAIVGDEIWAAGGIIDSRRAGSGDDATEGFQMEFITDTVEIYNLIEGEGHIGDQYPIVYAGRWVFSPVCLRVPRLFAKFCCISQEELYLVGGIVWSPDYGLMSLASVDYFDFAKQEWHHYGDLHVARHGHDVGLLNEERIVVVGGVSTRQQRALDEVEFFCTKTRESDSEVGALPWRMSGGALIVLN